jgi:hypothetical protein
MKRRTFLGTVAAGAGVLAAPRLGRDAAASTLRFVPAQDLALLDPIQSPPGSMIMRSCLVFDTLYGLDESYKAQPPMVEGHVIEDDGKTWKLALRDWLGFPNGEPARTCDVIASRQRWGKRDTFGQTLFSVTDELSAPSDKVVQFRLKKTVLDDPRCAGQDRRLFRDHRTRASDTDRTDRGHAGVHRQRSESDVRLAGFAAARGTALAVAGRSGRRRAAAHLPRNTGIPGRAILPLGEFYPATAYRTSRTGVPDGYSLFCSVRRP